MARQIIKMDLNRVEGDLEIELELDDHTVTDAWCVGTMYRGVGQILGIVIAFGGQWPHATYMSPGGVTCELTSESLAACLTAIDAYTEWYEQVVLGCSSEQWLALRTMDDFFAWLDEDEARQRSAVGVFTRFGRALGLHQTGLGTPHLLSAGCYYDPEQWRPPFEERHCLLPAGFYNGQTRQVEPFDPGEVAEHVRYSWYVDYGGGRHPWEGETQPDYQPESDRYTYAKAPRYRDQVVQLGPLSDLVIAGESLLTSFFQAERSEEHTS